MNNKNRAVALAAAFAIFPMTLLAGPVEFDGHFYEVIVDSGINWDDADSAANSLSFNGVTGHLATITSEGEDNFIESLRSSAALSKPEVWVGGFQDTGAAEPGSGWQWLNNEGAISTPDVPLLSYSNWLGPEPNNAGNEQHLGVGLGGQFGWNDEVRTSNIGGYVVEYDTETPATECIGGTGCDTNEGQTLTFPMETQAPAGSTIATNSFEYTDDPGRCGNATLTLFDDDGIADNELIIPPYLCGSPNFLVVAVDSTGVEVPEGTIFVENEVLDVLPDNLYECDGPVNPIPDPDLDPQHRDVVAWQTTNPAEMLENDLGGVAGFPGALAEVTFECGSSRGRVRSASYYVIGMHIDFGPGFELENNAAGNRDMFAALTKYKLQLLMLSVRESVVALDPADFRTLRVLLGRAIRHHGRGQYQAALDQMNLFVAEVETISYQIVVGENFGGEHLMRGGNIQFMYTDKLIPLLP